MSSFEGTVELRGRITGELFAALYYDAGLLQEESLTAASDFGHGAGAGLQYNLPIGPLRFDLAGNPGKHYAADSRWMFHFAVGLSY